MQMFCRFCWWRPLTEVLYKWFDWPLWLSRATWVTHGELHELHHQQVVDLMVLLNDGTGCWGGVIFRPRRIIGYIKTCRESQGFGLSPRSDVPWKYFHYFFFLSELWKQLICSDKGKCFPWGCSWSHSTCGRIRDLPQLARQVTDLLPWPSCRRRLRIQHERHGRRVCGSSFMFHHVSTS